MELIWVFYIALLLCLLLVALFAASEAALAATNRVRLRQLLRAQVSEESGAPSSGELSGEAQRFIATVTIAANVPLVAAAALSLRMAWWRYGPSWLAIAVCGGVALMSIALFQITPRLLVMRPGALDNLWWVGPARVYVALLSPFVRGLLLAGTLLLRPLGLLNAPLRRGEEKGESGLEHADEIRDLVDSAHASGALEEGRELIESIFTFGDTRVHEVMIPRPDIVALPLSSSTETILDTMQQSGLSRVPLYEENIDEIVGVLHAKDVLGCLGRGEWEFAPHGLKEMMRAPLFLPESQKIDEALASMRAQRSHLALVIDEFGGTAGLLTVEDILEELVGDIADEHDQETEDALAILDENTALADALLHTDDLRDEWNLTLPAGEFDTIGGFVIEQLGRAPLVGDRVETPVATLVVHTVRGRRPKKILITRKIAVKDES